jgi:hypothetical protein
MTGIISTKKTKLEIIYLISPHPRHSRVAKGRQFDPRGALRVATVEYLQNQQLSNVSHMFFYDRSEGRLVRWPANSSSKVPEKAQGTWTTKKENVCKANSLTLKETLCRDSFLMVLIEKY